MGSTPTVLCGILSMTGRTWIICKKALSILVLMYPLQENEIYPFIQGLELVGKVKLYVGESMQPKWYSPMGREMSVILNTMVTIVSL